KQPSHKVPEVPGIADRAFGQGSLGIGVNPDAVSALRPERRGRDGSQKGGNRTWLAVEVAERFGLLKVEWPGVAFVKLVVPPRPALAEKPTSGKRGRKVTWPGTTCQNAAVVQ